MTEIECDVYKTEKKENLYLYVPAEQGMSRVPEDLLSQFGEPEKALSFTLTEDKALAKEDPALVLKNLQEQGYHLQLPPADNKFG